MISVAEADLLLGDFRAPWPAESLPLDEAAGRILREDIRADREYPAQDRSRMDGIGILHADWERGERSFIVAGLSRAGDPRAALSRLSASAAACIEIMTGAPVPEGADTVIPYEDVVIDGDVARAREGAAVRPRQFVHAQGSDCAQGDVLVAAGVRLQAAHVAVAASVGKARLVVARRPRVAIIATGDELVDVHETPLEHQLRMSNAHGLAALFAPWAATSVHRCGDDPTALSAVLEEALAESDMLLVSGGVSAGKFDAVPATLESLGVEKVFHKVAQKPGKPLWFGVFDINENPDGASSSPLRPRSRAGERRAEPVEVGPGVRALVFGLPGNPVSSLVCARRFVLPLLWAKLGWSAPPAAGLPLANSLDAPSRLTQYLPVRVSIPDPEKRQGTGAGPVAESHAVNGSGDFATLGGSDGFVELPSDQNHYPAGAIMAFFPWSP